MKLYLFNHEYRYATEQMLLTLFPEERPEYPQGEPEGNRAELCLSEGKVKYTAVCRLVKDGLVYQGRAAADKALITDE